MRPISKKTAARKAECREFREQLKLDVDGRCEICGHDPTRVKWGQISWEMEEHHIARGIHRAKALCKRYAVLWLCWRCHYEEVHGNVEWPQSQQLAVLRRSRPQDFDLVAFNALTGWGKNRITEDDVKAWEE